MTQQGNGSENKLPHIDVLALILMIVLFFSTNYSIADAQKINVNGKWLSDQQILKLEDTLGHSVPEGFYKYDRLYGFRATGGPLNGSANKHMAYAPQHKLQRSYSQRSYSDIRHSDYTQAYPHDNSLGRYKWFERTPMND